MTKIEFKNKNGSDVYIFRVDITGHSDYAAYGSDIVCSAISMLFAAAGQQLWEYHETHDFQYECMLKEGEGHLEAEVSKDKPIAQRIRGMFEMLKTGAEMLAEIYPQNVEVSMV